MAVAAYCPYYLSEKDNKVYCEFAKLHPPDTLARQEVVFNYCADENNYKKCPFCIAMEHYYERKYAKEDKHGTNDKCDA